MRPTNYTVTFSRKGNVVRTLKITSATPDAARVLVSHLRELQDKLGTGVTWKSVRGYE